LHGHKTEQVWVDVRLARAKTEQVLVGVKLAQAENDSFFGFASLALP